MTEHILRFVAGGLIVALATLGIAQHGATHAAAESWTMIYGAVALACYSFVVCQLLMRWRMAALSATVVSFVVWLAVAFGLLASFGGST